MMEIKQKPRLHATWIDHDAISIVERLQKSGHACYLVGGCVRDLLAGLHPKDYDIATSALPNEVKRRVWGSYVIGKRFRLVLAKRGDQQYEIATFRRAGRAEDFTEGEDAPIGDNFFGTPEEDAIRRDFTINALFYDPLKDELLDYAHGREDIEGRWVRMIGDPATRIIEDPIRSLRAVRLSHKLGFSIEPKFRAAILENAAEVAKSPLPRRREEYLKFFRLEDPLPAIAELYDLQLMKHLLPSLHELWENPETFDICWHYLQGLLQVRDQKNTLELYMPLVLAFTRALTQDPQMEAKREIFLRDELGMFRAEISEVLHILDLSANLPPLPSFRKRGQRRQQAFIAQPNLEQAVAIARLDFTTTPEELAFWETALAALPK